jgi:lysophospholipid acyltransferase (LPLAT)-like uncharacterized protein
MTLPAGLRLVWGGVGLLARSWRLEVSGEEHVQTLRRRRTPTIFAVWHANLVVPLWHRRGESITLLVSGHRDGRRLATAAAAWGYESVFGSSTRGGVQGLRELIRCLRAGRDGAVTPDGPRGPAQEVKDGVIVAARSGGAAVVPIGVGSSAGWAAESWDRFSIPAPGSRVMLVYGEPVTFGREPRVAARRCLEKALEDAMSEAACRD